MTGYGQAACQIDETSYAVEIKTVNNRYFKTNIKLPEAMTFLAEDVEKLLRENICRGTTTYVLRMKGPSAEAIFDIDEAALQQCIQKLSQIAHSTDMKYNVDIASLLSLPGIVQPGEPDEQQARQIREAVLNITGDALQKLKQMRRREGAALAADLTEHCQVINKKLEQIKQKSPVVVQQYQEKLKKRVDGLLAAAKLNLDEETLAREVAVFAERCDISEEIARLASHLEQFTQTCTRNEQAGRRLDFISQEMLREANTIASKAADIEIAQYIVEVKCRIDRLKEQVQNVE